VRLVELVERVALSDSSERTRYESVRLMGRLLGTTPALRGTLERVAQADAERQIRGLAAGTLAGARASDDDQRI
jgi:hypothetical protein